VTERPILFSAPMVRAILAGTKTQTRRIIKCPPHYQIEEKDDGKPWPWMYDSERDRDHFMPCPYGEPGTRLWVREAWRAVWSSDDEPPRAFNAGYRFWYEADAPHQDGFGKLRPSIHMPRCASRITLEVTGVRVEKLQDISEADAMAEGVALHDDGKFTDYMSPTGYAGNAVSSYRSLWTSINGPSSWEANPYVWAVEFRRLTP